MKAKAIIIKAAIIIGTLALQSCGFDGVYLP
jgi:hypothetical protein